MEFYHHQKKNNPILFLLLVWIIFTSCDCRRYRLCSEGCCIHEYCAYHLICYPKIHCRFGCPDGFCTGTGNGDISASINGIHSQREVTSKDTDNSSGTDDSDTPLTDKSKDEDEMGFSAKEGIQVSQGKGICMPLAHCSKNDRCAMGHSCTFNFNLGYNVCQYNIQIGTTLCYDSRGHLKLIPST